MAQSDFIVGTYLRSSIEEIGSNQGFRVALTRSNRCRSLRMPYEVARYGTRRKGL